MTNDLSSILLLLVVQLKNLKSKLIVQQTNLNAAYGIA